MHEGRLVVISVLSPLILTSCVFQDILIYHPPKGTILWLAKNLVVFKVSLFFYDLSTGSRKHNESAHTPIKKKKSQSETKNSSFLLCVSVPTLKAGF